MRRSASTRAHPIHRRRERRAGGGAAQLIELPALGAVHRRSPTTSRSTGDERALAAKLRSGQPRVGTVMRCDRVAVARRPRLTPRTTVPSRVARRHVCTIGGRELDERARRFGDGDSTKLWTLDGVLERDFNVGFPARRAPLPDGVQSATTTTTTTGTTSTGRSSTPSRRTASVNAVAATRDGQHIISGSEDHLVKVWSVASKSLREHLRRGTSSAA